MLLFSDVGFENCHKVIVNPSQLLRPHHLLLRLRSFLRLRHRLGPGADRHPDGVLPRLAQTFKAMIEILFEITILHRDTVTWMYRFGDKVVKYSAASGADTVASLLPSLITGTSYLYCLQTDISM